MWGAVAYVALVAGAGLLIRGIVDPAVGFFAAAAALAAWRARLTALRRLEATLAAALVVVGAASGDPIEGAGAAAIAVLLIELMRLM